jgi:deoxyribodipyrimidine photo-lyase
VAGTGSSKPYLFNADNVARFAPPAWHSPGTAIDTSYEILTAWARGEAVGTRWADGAPGREGSAWAAPVGPKEGTEPPPLWHTPPDHLGWVAPDAAAVAGQEVWLVHPWSLGALPADLPPNTLVLGLAVAEFHRAWPWNPQRWAFVGQRMAELTPMCWRGPAAALRAALAGARRVRGWADPHNGPGTGVLAAGWAGPRCEWVPPPALFAPQDRLQPSFSKWWAAVTRGRHDAGDLLSPGVRPTPGPPGLALFQPLFSESVG